MGPFGPWGVMTTASWGTEPQRMGRLPNRSVRIPIGLRSQPEGMNSLSLLNPVGPYGDREITLTANLGVRTWAQFHPHPFRSVPIPTGRRSQPGTITFWPSNQMGLFGHGDITSPASWGTGP